MGLALRTEPAICLRKNFLLAELVQALAEREICLLWLLLAYRHGVIKDIPDVHVGRATSELLGVSWLAAEKGINGIGSPVKQDGITLANERWC